MTGRWGRGKATGEKTPHRERFPGAAGRPRRGEHDVMPDSPLKLCPKAAISRLRCKADILFEGLGDQALKLG
jgi:hypothetical protein